MGRLQVLMRITNIEGIDDNWKRGRIQMTILIILTAPMKHP